MTNTPGVLRRHVERVDTALVRLLAVVGALAVLRGALAPWSFNTVGIERPGFRVGMVLAVVGAAAVVAGPRHPLGAALAVVGGGRAAHPAAQRVLWSLGGEMWFAGFVWTGAGALLLLVAGVVSAAVVVRNWTDERGESAGERDPARDGE